LNDAFVAAALGGLKRYHDHHGVSIDSLRMSMPINIRSEGADDVAGNSFVPARFVVPLTIDDPIERMRTVKDLVRTVREEPALAATEPIAGILNRLPVGITTQIFGSMLKGIDFVTSNVPGAPIPVYIAGAKLEAQYPFGPLAGAAMNLTLLSYLDELQIGVNMDRAAIPDPETFGACMRDGFDEISKVA
jgi:diacylglycerol O-acyltransferase